MGKPTKRSQGWKGTQEKRKREQEANNEAMIEKAVENVLKKKKIIADDNNEQNSFLETSFPGKLSRAYLNPALLYLRITTWKT